MSKGWTRLGEVESEARKQGPIQTTREDGMRRKKKQKRLEAAIQTSEGEEDGHTVAKLCARSCEEVPAQGRREHEGEVDLEEGGGPPSQHVCGHSGSRKESPLFQHFKQYALVYLFRRWLFHATHSSKRTRLPPKISSELPNVRSTRPPLSRSTSARSSTAFAPPA